MNFARTEMLFLVWVVPPLLLIFVYGMKRRKNILTAFASPKGRYEMVVGQSTARRHIKMALVLFVVLLLALTLAGPQYGFQWQEVERKGIDIMIALDCSKSMLAQDLSPTRLDRAKREVYDLLPMLHGDRIGLVAFAGTAFIQCPLTMDYESFHLFLRSLTPEFLPIGGSDIAGALRTAMTGFKPADPSEKAVIFITDGENTGPRDPLEAARQAAQVGIKIFCIGVGGDAGAPIPEKTGGFKKDRTGEMILSRLDETALKQIAAVTGGAYVRSVAGDMDLDIIYHEEIRGKMESTTLSTRRQQVWENRFQWFLALAIGFLTLDLFLTAAIPKQWIVGFFIVVVLIHPRDTAADSRDGFLAYQKGDYAAALEALTTDHVKNPEDSEIWYNLGNTYYRLGDFKAAESHFEKAAQAENEKLRQKALYNMGNVAFRKGKLETAFKRYSEALRLDPEDLQAKENIAFVKKLMEQRKQDGADQTPPSDKGKDKNEKSGNPQEAPDDSEKNSGEKKNEQSDASQDQKKEDGKPDASSPEFGRAMDREDAADNAGKKEAETGASHAKKPEAEQPNGSEEKPFDRRAAEQMLDNLQDKPGKAVGAGINRRKVDKDW